MRCVLVQVDPAVSSLVKPVVQHLLSHGLHHRFAAHIVLAAISTSARPGFVVAALTGTTDHSSCFYRLSQKQVKLAWGKNSDRTDQNRNRLTVLGDKAMPLMIIHWYIQMSGERCLVSVAHWSFLMAARARAPRVPTVKRQRQERSVAT